MYMYIFIDIFIYFYIYVYIYIYDLVNTTRIHEERIWLEKIPRRGP